jgi:hypothetical protein
LRWGQTELCNNSAPPNGLPPGKSCPTPDDKTLVQQQQGQQGQLGGFNKSGSAVVDHSFACETDPDQAECVLSAAERTRLLPTYQARVNAAETHYLTALGQLRVEELLKKSPEKSDLMFEIFLEVIGSVALSSLTHAVKMLRAGSADMLEGAVRNSEQLAAALRSDAGDKQIETALKGAVSSGKKKITKAKDADPSVASPKAAKIGYMDMLASQAGDVYESLRERAPAGLTDVAFLVLFAAFKNTAGHSVDAYRTALEAKLDRFDKSKIGEIGVTRNDDAYGPAQLVGAGGPAQWDTKVFWVRTPGGRRLGLYRREYREIPKEIYKDGQMAFKQPASPIDDMYLQVEDAKRPYSFVRYVPLEFEGAAVAMHRAKWEGEPLERDARSPEEFALSRSQL